MRWTESWIIVQLNISQPKNTYHIWSAALLDQNNVRSSLDSGAIRDLIRVIDSRLWVHNCHGGLKLCGPVSPLICKWNWMVTSVVPKTKKDLKSVYMTIRIIEIATLLSIWIVRTTESMHYSNIVLHCVMTGTDRPMLWPHNFSMPKLTVTFYYNKRYQLYYKWNI